VPRRNAIEVQGLYKEDHNSDHAIRKAAMPEDEEHALYYGIVYDVAPYLHRLYGVQQHPELHQQGEDEQDDNGKRAVIFK